MHRRQASALGDLYAAGFLVPGGRCATLVAQFILQNPPLGVLGKAVAEFDVTRQGVVGDGVDGPLARKLEVKKWWPIGLVKCWMQLSIILPM